MDFIAAHTRYIVPSSYLQLADLLTFYGVGPSHNSLFLNYLIAVDSRVANFSHPVASTNRARREGHLPTYLILSLVNQA